MIRNRANPGHENFRSLQSCVKLEIVDLKDAHRRFHPREQETDEVTRRRDLAEEAQMKRVLRYITYDVS
jgi:hypothetical protein